MKNALFRYFEVAHLSENLKMLIPDRFFYVFLSGKPVFEICDRKNWKSVSEIEKTLNRDRFWLEILSKNTKTGISDIFEELIYRKIEKS